LLNRRDFLWQAAGAGVASLVLAGTAQAQGTAGNVDAGREVKGLRCALYPQQNRWRTLIDLSRPGCVACPTSTSW
jgi:hypothetical protein